MSEINFKDKPFIYRPTFSDYAQATHDERKKKMHDWAQYSFGPNHEESLKHGLFEHEDKNVTQLFTGLMDIDLAFAESMDRDYSRGMFSKHAGYQKTMAQDMMPLLDTDEGGAFKWQGTALDIDAERRAAIAEVAGRSRWNFATQLTNVDQLPIVNNFTDDISSYITDNPPREGWDPAAGLQALKEGDPVRYNFYKNKLGGEEALLDVVKDARDPMELFYKLGNESRMRSIGDAFGVWQENTSTSAQFWKQTEHLFVNGIINDPDMLASIVISAGLSLTGIGAGAGAAILAAKAAHKMGKITKNLSRLQRLKRIVTTPFTKTANAARWVNFKMGGAGETFFTHSALFAQRFINYMPERIAPHLLRKGINFRAAKGVDRYNNIPWIARWGINRVGDMGEGYITGGLAEWANQQNKIAMGFQDNIDWGKIKEEAWIEAKLSPFINPIVGGMMSLPQMAVGLPMKKWFETNKSDMPSILNATLEHTRKWTDPKYIEESIGLVRSSKDLTNKMNSILREDAQIQGVDVSLPSDGTSSLPIQAFENDFLSAAITQLRVIAGNDNKQFLELLNTGIDQVIKDVGDGPKLTAQEFTHQLLGKIKGSWQDFAKGKLADLGKETLRVLLGYNKSLGDIARATKKYNLKNDTKLTTTEFIKMHLDNNDASFMLSEEMKEAAKSYYENRNEGASWESLTDAEKIEVAKEFARERYNRIEVTEQAVKKIVGDWNELRENAGADPINTDNTEAPTVVPRVNKEAEASKKNARRKRKEAQNTIDAVRTQGREIKAQITETVEPEERQKLKAKRDILAKELRKARKRIHSLDKFIDRVEKLQKQIKTELENWERQVKSQEGGPEVWALIEQIQELDKQLSDDAKVLDSLGQAYYKIVEAVRVNLLLTGQTYQLFSAKDKEGKAYQKKFVKVDELSAEEKDLLQLIRDEISTKDFYIDDDHTVSDLDAAIEGYIAEGAEAPKGWKSKRKPDKIKLANELMNRNIVVPKTEEITKLQGEIVSFLDSILNNEIEKITVKDIKEKLNDKIQSLSSKLENHVRNTKEYTESSKRQRAYESTYKKYRAEVTRLDDQKGLNDAIADYYSLENWSNLIDSRREAQQIIDLRFDVAVARIKAMQEAGETHISRGELMDMFPDLSYYKQEYKELVADLSPDQVSESKWYKKQIPLGDALSTIGKDRNTLTEKLKNLSIGSTIQDVMPALPTRANSLLDTALHAVSDEVLKNIKIDVDAIISNKNRPQSIDIKRSLEGDANAYVVWHGRLTDILGSDKVTADEENVLRISAQRMYATMPDLFRDLGVAPFVIFKEALRPEHQNLTPNQLNDISFDLDYDLYTVISILNKYRGRVYSQLGGHKRVALDRILKDIDSDLINEAKPSAVTDKYKAMVFLEGLEASQRAFNQEMASQENYGFVLEADERTGHFDETPSNIKQSYSNWERRVISGIRDRVDVVIRNKHGNLKNGSLTRLIERLGLPEETLENPDVDTITEAILANVGKLGTDQNNNRATLRAFGNGDIDWQPANLLAKQLVDFHSMPEVTRQADKNIIGEDTALLATAEGSVLDGVPTDVVAAHRISHVAPTGVWTLKRITGQAIRDLRVSEVLKLIEFDEETGRPKYNITPERRAAFKEFIKTWKFETPDTLLPEDHDAYRAFPHWLGGSLEEAPITREQMLDLATTFFYDLPNDGAMFVQDQIIAARPYIRYNTEMQQHTSLLQLSHGDDIIGPFSQGEIFAWGFTGPNGREISHALLERSNRLRDKWLADKGVTTEEIVNDIKYAREPRVNIFNDDVRSDRNSSGSFEQRAAFFSAIVEKAPKEFIAALQKTSYGQEEVTVFTADGVPWTGPWWKALEQFGIREVILSARFGPKGEADFYKIGAIEIGKKLQQHRDKGSVSSLGNLLTAFDLLETHEITSARKWQEIIDSYTISDRDRNILSALRDVFKVPVMRRTYGGSMPAFQREFDMTALNPGKGAQAMKALGEALGVEITVKETEAFGKALLEHSRVQDNVILLDLALGIDGDMKKVFTDYLQVNRTGEFFRENIQQVIDNWESWVDAQEFYGPREEGQTFTLHRADGTTEEIKAPTVSVAENSQLDASGRKGLLYRLKDLEESMEAKFKQMAEQAGRTDVDKIKARYGDKIKRFYDYMYNKYVKNNIELTELSSDQEMNREDWKMLHEIFEETEGLSHKDNMFFRAMNMITATNYRANLERAGQVAKALGLFEAKRRNEDGSINWEPEALEMIQNLFVYAGIGPSSYNHRGHGQGHFGPHFTSHKFDRVGDDRFIKFMEQADYQMEAGRWTREEYLNKLDQFIKDAGESLGLWDIYPSPFQDMDPKEFRAHMDDALMIQELLWLSQFRHLPASVFGDEKAHVIGPDDGSTGKNWESDTSVMDYAIRRLFESSRERHSTIENELAWEKELVNHPNIKSAREKIAGYIDASVARDNPGGGLATLMTREADPSEVVEGGRSTRLRTDRPSGPLFNQPLFKRQGFFQKGNIRLHKLRIEEEINEEIGKYDNFRRDSDVEADPILGWDGKKTTGDEFGWAPPFKWDDLPRPRDTVRDFLDIFPHTEVGARAAELRANLAYWAQQRGLLENLEQNPENYAYFYLVREVERIRREQILWSTRQDLNKSQQDEMYVLMRNKWLGELSNLTRISRNVRLRLRDQLSVYDQDWELAFGTDEKALDKINSWIDLLTSQASEGKPGRLLMPTRMHKPLNTYKKRGPAPVEGMPILTKLQVQAIVKDGKEISDVIQGEIDVKDLVYESGIIHSSDFMRFVIGQDWQAQVSGYLANWQNYDLPQVRMVGQEGPGWQRVSLEDSWKRKKYKRISKQLGVDVKKGNEGWEFGVDDADKHIILDMWFQDHEDGVGYRPMPLNLKVIEQVSRGENITELKAEFQAAEQLIPKTKRKDVQERMVQRNLFSQANLEMLLRKPTDLKGSNIHIQLTAEAAQQMFAVITNQRTFYDATYALNTKQGINTASMTMPDGTVVQYPVVPDAQRFRRSLGFSMEEDIKRVSLDSSALETLMRVEAKRRNQTAEYKVVQDSLKTIDNVPLSLVDLDFYSAQSPDGNFTGIWDEAVYGPIRQLITRMNTDNLNLNDLSKRLRDMIQSSRDRSTAEGHSDFGTLVILNSMLTLERGEMDPLIALHENHYMPFLNHEIFDVFDNNTTLVNVQNLVTNAQVLYAEIKGNLAENGYGRNNPLVPLAKRFAMEFESAIEQDATQSPNRPDTIDAKIDRIQTVSDTMSLRDKNTYVDSENNTYRRVSDIIPQRKELKTASQNLTLETSQLIGTEIDTLVRDITNGMVDSDIIAGLRKKPDTDEYKKARAGLETLHEKYPVISDIDVLQNFILEVDAELTSLQNKGWIPLANNLIVRDKNLGIAGELDILLYNQDTGRVAILDMKSKRSDEAVKISGRDRQRYSKQLSLYALILNNAYGIRVNDLEIMPIRVQYPTGKLSSSTSRAELKERLSVPLLLEGVDTTEGTLTFNDLPDMTGDFRTLIDRGFDTAQRPNIAFVQWLKSKGYWDNQDYGLNAMSDADEYAQLTQALMRELGGDGTYPGQENFDEWITNKNNVVVVDIETTLVHEGTQRDIVSVNIYDKSTDSDDYITYDHYFKPAEAKQVLKKLREYQGKGYKIVTHNGLAFDFTVLGQVAKDTRLANLSAVPSFDIQTNLMGAANYKFSSKAISVKNLAQVLLKEGKTDKAEFAALYWKRANNLDVELSDLDAISPDRLEGQSKQEIVTDMNNLSPAEAKNKLETYTKGDTHLTAKIFDALHGKSQTLSLEGRKITTPEFLMPAWREGFGKQRWNILLRNRFRRTNPEMAHTIDDVASELSSPASMQYAMDAREELKTLDQAKEFLASQAIDTALEDYSNMPDDLLYLETLPDPPEQVESSDVLIRDRLFVTQNNWHKSHKKMRELSELKGDPYLREVSETIEAMVNENIVNQKQARGMRALILKAYSLNPMILRDVTFDYTKAGERIRSSAIRVDGKDYIRLGEELYELGAGPINPILILAHELTHVAHMKFIEENSAEWRRWEILAGSRNGERMITKMVKTMHNGVMTREAEKEVERYLSSPKEFIAGLGSYFLMADLPKLMRDTDFTKPEHSIFRESLEWVRKIFNYFRRVFTQLEFSMSEELENKEVNRMLHRLFGYDTSFEAKSKLLSPVDNPNQENYLRGPNWEERHETPDVDVAWKYNDSTYEAMVGRHDDLKYRRDVDPDNMTDNEVAELLSLSDSLNVFAHDSVAELEGSEVARRMEVKGLTRYQYFSGRRKLMNRYPKYFDASLERVGSGLDQDSDIRVFNLQAFIREHTRTNSGGLTEMDHAIVLQMLIEELKKAGGEHTGYGTKIDRKAGKTFGATTNFISRVLSFGQSQDNWVRDLLVAATIGPTGANATYNAGTILPIWITAMLDDQVVSMVGNYANVLGSTSLTRSIEKLRPTQDAVFTTWKEITRIFHPVETRLRGGIGSKSGEKLKGLGTMVAVLVDSDNPSAEEFKLTGDTKTLFDALSDENKTEVEKLVRKIALDLSNFMDVVIERKSLLRDWGPRANSKVGWKLRNIFDASENGADFENRFTSALSELIRDKILSEPDLIDPVSTFSARILPDTSNVDSLLADLQSISENHETFYNSLLQYISYTTDENNVRQGWRGFEPRFIADRESAAHTHSENWMRNFQTRVDNPETQATALAEIQNGVHLFMKQLALGSITWSDLGITPNQHHTWRAYNNAVIETESNYDPNNTRLLSLYRTGHEDRHANAIGWVPAQNSRVHFSQIHRNSPLGVHTYNLVNRSAVGTYLPNDAWFIPEVSEAASRNEAIRDGVILEPVTLVNDYMRGIGDEVTEQIMMVENFGMYGTIGDVLTLWEMVNKTSGVGGWYDMTGKKLPHNTMQMMDKSFTTLREKYRYIRGIKENNLSHDSIGDFIANVAPGITKVAFGGNVALATFTVEHVHNAFTQAFGPEGLVGAIKTFFMPLTNTSFYQTEEYRITARDLADFTNSMSQIWVPEYERPVAADINRNWKDSTVDFTNRWGNQMMRPASWLMESTAVSRAQIFRKALYELVGNGDGPLAKLQAELQEQFDEGTSLVSAVPREGTVNYRYGQVEVDGEMVTKLEKGQFAIEDLHIPQPVEFEKLLRKHGISTMRYGRIVHYMLQSGLLHQDNWDNLLKVLGTDYNTRDNSYSPAEIFDRLNKSTDQAIAMEAGIPRMDSRELYHDLLDTVGALKIMEKQYVQEVLVNPNPFDIYTGDGRADKVLEVFRRYGMLFISQLVMRNARNMGIGPLATRVMLLMVLDTIYMMCLRLANGDKIEDLLEEYEESPTTFFMKYGVRLPIWGRYGSYFGEIVAAMLQGGFGRNTAGFIPSAGLISMMRHLGNYGEIAFGEREMTGQDWVQLMKYVPFFGDSLVRLGVYGMAGQDNLRRANRRGSSGYSEGVARQGMAPLPLKTSLEDYMLDTFLQMGLQPRWDYFERKTTPTLPGLPAANETHRNPLRAPESPVQPTQQAQVPQTTPETTMAQRGSQDAVGQIGQQATSLELPDSEQLT